MEIVKEEQKFAETVKEVVAEAPRLITSAQEAEQLMVQQLGVLRGKLHNAMAQYAAKPELKLHDIGELGELLKAMNDATQSQCAAVQLLQMLNLEAQRSQRIQPVQ